MLGGRLDLVRFRLRLVTLRLCVGLRILARDPRIGICIAAGVVGFSLQVFLRRGDLKPFRNLIGFPDSDPLFPIIQKPLARGAILFGRRETFLVTDFSSFFACPLGTRNQLVEFFHPEFLGRLVVRTREFLGGPAFHIF
ncbi:hypothetical protein DF286_04065 [Sphingosinicella humi]|uniref:Uncharacterized protein n=1 Tax=Allosphingosinicella humi TaxID=2068657 RepID=A0A2U2J1D1_9SPHN|nr:hypothetical protein DF286_04065 [Sphingosinicella humi]